MDIKLEQYLSGGSLWGSIQALEPFPFFASNSAISLDSQTIMNYGDRLVFSKIENKTLDEMAIYLVRTYSEKWNSLISANIKDFNISDSNSKKTVETNSNSETRILDKKDAVKTVAYNSDDLTVTDGNDSLMNDELNSESTLSRTESNLNLINSFDNLNYVQKLNIITVVLKDVVDYLTLSTY